MKTKSIKIYEEEMCGPIQLETIETRGNTGFAIFFLMNISFEHVVLFVIKQFKQITSINKYSPNTMMCAMKSNPSK